MNRYFEDESEFNDEFESKEMDAKCLKTVSYQESIDKNHSICKCLKNGERCILSKSIWSQCGWGTIDSIDKDNKASCICYLSSTQIKHNQLNTMFEEKKDIPDNYLNEDLLSINPISELLDDKRYLHKSMDGQTGIIQYNEANNSNSQSDQNRNEEITIIKKRFGKNQDRGKVFELNSDLHITLLQN